MTAEKFFEELRRRFIAVLDEHDIGDEPVQITCRSLTPEEAIGKTKRQDFPIITGDDVMIQAQFRDSFGQAFTDAPTAFEGTLSEVLDMDIVNDAHGRGLFIAVMNAVMGYLGLCRGNVHCRTEGPEYCAQDMLGFLRREYPDVERIALIGYQSALLDMLSHSEYDVRVLDLNPKNVGEVRYGVKVEDGIKDYDEVVMDYADLVLCTGSTACNGSIVNFIDIGKEVVFYGTTFSGGAVLMDQKRSCFAHLYA